MSADQRIAVLESQLGAAQARLAESEAGGGAEEFLAAVLDVAPAYITRCDSNLRIMYINRLPEGTPRSEVIGASITNFIDPADADTAREALEVALATGLPQRYEVGGSSSTSGPGIYDVFATPIDLPDGRRDLCVYAVEVSAARQREKALAESEEKLRLAIDASGVGLWSLDLNTGVMTWDERNRALFGREVPPPLEMFGECVHPDDRARIDEAIKRDMRHGGAFESPSYRIVRPSGEVRWIITRGRTLTDDAGVPVRVAGGNLDVTARRVAEEQVRQAQRLDAIGRLTAGVAHNFNNMLTVVMSSLDLLRRRTGGDDLALIDDARSAARRGAEMVRQLMTFTGQRLPVERRPRSIADIVERVVAICRRTFARHIVLECEIEPSLPPVACSEADIEQILMNLLLNARDAVLERDRPSPRISVAVGRVALEAVADAGDGADGVRLRVTDDGPGMSAEILAHAFDPFFTTKPVGGGTGLGLTTSYAIARELGGTLTAAVEPGRGASFALTLPASEQPVVPASGEVEVPRGRCGRVLVIDDEPPIRRAVQALLEDAGFDVVTVAGGDEALTLMSRGGPAVDVVLLDRSMPGAPGESYLPAIRALAPDARVVLFTGQQVEGDLAGRFDAVMIKPVTAEALFSTIHALLPGAAAV